jgi:hypothetical protein
MPKNYDNLRLEMACSGLLLENSKDIYNAKMLTLSGLSYKSAENINKGNEQKIEAFNGYIEEFFPYIQRARNKSGNSRDDLISDYKKLIEQFKKQEK